MDNKDWSKVWREAERQGWTIEKTTKGYKLFSPDGRTIVAFDRLHASSDSHALDRTIRRMKRQGGFLWPPPRMGGT